MADLEEVQAELQEITAELEQVKAKANKLERSYATLRAELDEMTADSGSKAIPVRARPTVLTCQRYLVVMQDLPLQRMLP